MQKIIGIVVLAAGIVGGVHAGTWDDVAAIEAAKQQKFDKKNSVETKRSNREMTAPVPIWHTLSDGRQVNMANWTVALFLRSDCSYCKQFAPVLKEYSSTVGLRVSPFSLDGQGDGVFEPVMLATPEVMVEFFIGGIPIATPTTFLVNVNTMATYPLLQGATDRQGLAARVDEVLRIALNKGEK